MDRAKLDRLNAMLRAARAAGDKDAEEQLTRELQRVIEGVLRD